MQPDADLVGAACHESVLGTMPGAKEIAAIPWNGAG